MDSSAVKEMEENKWAASKVQLVFFFFSLPSLNSLFMYPLWLVKYFYYDDSEKELKKRAVICGS